MNQANLQSKKEIIFTSEQLSKLAIRRAPVLITNTQFIEKYTNQAHLERILTAREWKVDQAFDMWKRWVQWRQQYKADDIKEEEIASELKIGKAFWHGYDKLGNPTLIIQARKHFPNQGSQEVLIRYFLYLMEKGIKLADEAGTGKISVIWDRNGVTSKNFDSGMFSLVKKIMNMLQDNYAERLHVAVTLYPNFFVKAMMAVMRPFLSERSRSKIIMMNTAQELQQYWTTDNLMLEHKGTSSYIYKWPADSVQAEQNDELQAQSDNLISDEEAQKQLALQLLKDNNVDEKDINYQN